MHTITIGRFPTGVLPALSRPVAMLRRRLLLWLRARRTLAEMAEADPRILADAGAAPPAAASPGLAAFRIDPRPLWSAGLTPLPCPPTRPQGEHADRARKN